jgi:hypothetical protein
MFQMSDDNEDGDHYDKNGTEADYDPNIPTEDDRPIDHGDEKHEEKSPELVDVEKMGEMGEDKESQQPPDAEPSDEEALQEDVIAQAEVAVAESSKIDKPASREKTSEPTILTGKDRREWRVMSRFEYARLISAAAKMFAYGSAMDPRIICHSDDYLVRAKCALDFRAPDYQFPIYIERPMPDGSVEVWYVEELILPHELLTYGLDMFKNTPLKS